MRLPSRAGQALAARPPGWSLVVCEIDRKVGGAYRYVWPGADGTEFGMRGGYREVASPERLVNTESFDKPWHPGDALVTTVLVGQGGRTVLTTTLLYASREGQGIGRPLRETIRPETIAPARDLLSRVP